MKYNVREYEHFPVRYWNHWLDDKQPTILVQGVDPGSKAKDILSPTAFAHIRRLFGRRGRDERLAEPDLEPGRKARGRLQRHQGGVERRLRPCRPPPLSHQRGGRRGAQANHARRLGVIRMATFSPDGKALFFKYAPQNQEVYNLPRLYRDGVAERAAIATLVTQRLRRRDRRVRPDARQPHGLPARLGSRKGKSLSRIGRGRRAGQSDRAGRRAGYTALVIPEKAASPELIAGYGSSVSPSGGGADRPRRPQAYANLTRHRHRRSRRHRLASRLSISISPAPRAAASTI